MSLRTKKQDNAYEKFNKLKIGALFMKMGTGKTKVAVDLINYNNVDFCIYITPFSTKTNIENELSKWQINCNYEIIGYETIQSSSKEFLRILESLKDKRCFIVADESIFIKNENTKRFNRLLQLRGLCEYALILNGTPISKDEWDLYNQMWFLSPKIIDMSRQQFLNTFFKKITYKKLGEREHSFYKFSEVNAKMLQKMISPYIFECELDFDKQESSDYKYINCEKNDYVLEKQNQLKKYIESGDSDVIIGMLVKLSRISAMAKEKNDAVCDYIKNKQVIVYCEFLDEIGYISSKVDCFVITGETQNRDAIIEQFKNGDKPLLMTYGIGAYSLNLQFCNEIVYSSLTFDYGKVEQSRYRIKRIGQKEDIKYTYILGDFGINKMKLDNLERKQTLENLIKDKLNRGTEWLKHI